MADDSNVLGVIGAVSGVAGLVVSVLAYRRANAIKALDLRLELSRASDSLDLVVSGAEDYLDYVHQSHQRVLAAIGSARSGEWIKFDGEFSNDKIRLRGLLASLPKRPANLENLSPEQLEASLAAMHTLHSQLLDLRGKYCAVFDRDEERRKEIRSQHTR